MVLVKLGMVTDSGAKKDSKKDSNNNATTPPETEGYRMDDQTKQLLTSPAFWKKTIADNKNPEGKNKCFLCVCTGQTLILFLFSWYPLVTI